MSWPPPSMILTSASHATLAVRYRSRGYCPQRIYLLSRSGIAQKSAKPRRLASLWTWRTVKSWTFLWLETWSSTVLFRNTLSKNRRLRHGNINRAKSSSVRRLKGVDFWGFPFESTWAPLRPSSYLIISHSLADSLTPVAWPPSG